ncbi:hypothetical protein LOF14_00635 [Klebsiella variicola subsp. variicola]|nr:hypothetical protein LOF14_00635 [Klebsiella variicola subsp. variicola]
MEQLHNAELIQLEVVEFEELPNEYAITIPSKRIIKLRADTHESASKGESRGRFTVAHEPGAFDSSFKHNAPVCVFSGTIKSSIPRRCGMAGQ